MTRIGYAEVIGGATGGTANAGWFGDGRDGDLYVSAGQTYVFDVVLDEGQVVKQFRNVYIGEGATVKTSGRCNGMVWAVQGDFENRGTITMDKCAPLLNGQEELCAQQRHVKLLGGITGGDAGVAGVGQDKMSSSSTASNYKAGGTPGKGFVLGGGYGPGSGSLGNAGGDAEPRPPIGTTIPYPGGAGAGKYGAGAGSGSSYMGGAGPGGSAAVYVYYSSEYGKNGNAGNAVGGGLFVLYVGGRFVNAATGVISADGGNGANGTSAGKRGEGGASGTRNGASGGGGGAGGGIIAVVHTGDYTNQGSIHANGGTRGAAGSSSLVASYATDGSAGPVLITTLDELLAS